MCSKLTIIRHKSDFNGGVFTVNSEHISFLFPVFPLLALKICLLGKEYLKKRI